MTPGRGVSTVFVMEPHFYLQLYNPIYLVDSSDTWQRYPPEEQCGLTSGALLIGIRVGVPKVRAV